MLDIENIESLFYEVVNSDDWKELQEKFNNADDIYVLGHGGNLAVASHAAIDISRLSNGTKNAMCPDSATVVTSLINDTDFDHWMHQWLKKCLILGFSSSGTSRDLIKAFQWGYSNDIPIACITAKPLTERVPGLSEVVANCDYYHTIEVLSLLLQYELTHGSGKVCPPIGGNKPEDIAHYNSNREVREIGFKDELKNIAVDFEVIPKPKSNGNEVLLECIASLKNIFHNDKMQINGPIDISAVINQLNLIEGVQSIPTFEIFNKSGGIYSNNVYDFDLARKHGIIYPSLDPCIFEIKYPNRDIRGRIVKP